MSGLEVVLIGANIAAGIVGFIASNILQRRINKKHHKKQEMQTCELNKTLERINEIVNRPYSEYAESTPIDADPYAESEEELIELKPFYNTKTNQTEYRYIKTPRIKEKRSE